LFLNGSPVAEPKKQLLGDDASRQFLFFLSQEQAAEGEKKKRGGFGNRVFHNIPVASGIVKFVIPLASVDRGF